ncbi:tRNA pseudouridine(38-40) synthase TruA [Blochmannia endosymbiont of Polyrhachis (Hedomyrma) turneri]|uniref:tRNA pseudouridine(38-40) synthase TruA n=1 Tax=Blochmannia endosymbiont of Polyrhachis (Hedomyrma) turneri TaxID=1505596 RepID=UPI00061A6D88|nr:tRNA pseudouridine(38-40) synthase TruA [Blochmannia endosymbiont of Polyrhachis (Hedomyrma) turneri]AKC60059.1 tRNA pseudouridine synthase A [Blochmannia endosymbiont of Polyrhachis (Hedomyrma) turneri]
MKLILGIEYNGSAYFGWQRQKDVLTIQECLENAISVVANEAVNVFCASRTDTGVHAVCQVVHFNTNIFRSCFSWMSGINSNLPADIVVRWIIESPDIYFHARFSAVSRRYRYIIYNSDTRSALFTKRVGYYKKFLNIEKMRDAAQCLLGEKDFSSFCTSKSQSLSFYRNVHFLSIFRYGYYVIIEIQANAFLHNMIRNIIGSLVEVGCGNRPVGWITELLLLRDRSLAGTMIASDGLYLIKIEYPSYYFFPDVRDNYKELFFL